MTDADSSSQGQSPPPRRSSVTPASLFIVLLLLYLVIEVRLIVLLLLFALLFATLVEGPVLRFQRRGLPRSVSILLVYLVFLGVLAGFSFLIVPTLTNEALTFWEEAPVVLEDLAEEWRTSDNPLLSTTGYRILAQLRFQMENPPTPTGETAIGFLSIAGGTVFGIVATFVIGFYYLMEKHVVKRLVLGLIRPDQRQRVDVIWNSVESKVGDWLRGQLLLMLIIGVSAGVGYAIMDVRFWLLLAVWAGLTEIIPILGPWIGGIPAVLLALADSWQKAIIVGVFLLFLQFAENSILVPRVMQGTIGLSPLVVFIAVMTGGQFFGPLGALLAIPIAAAVQVIISDVLSTRAREGWPDETQQAELPEHPPPQEPEPVGTGGSPSSEHGQQRSQD